MPSKRTENTVTGKKASERPRKSRVAEIAEDLRLAAGDTVKEVGEKIGVASEKVLEDVVKAEGTVKEAAKEVTAAAKAKVLRTGFSFRLEPAVQRIEYIRKSHFPETEEGEGLGICFHLQAPLQVHLQSVFIQASRRQRPGFGIAQQTEDGIAMAVKELHGRNASSI